MTYRSEAGEIFNECSGAPIYRHDEHDLIIGLASQAIKLRTWGSKDTAERWRADTVALWTAYLAARAYRQSNDAARRHLERMGKEWAGR